MQTTPHPPQLLRSFCWSTHTPLHAICPVVQQMPETQLRPAPHARLAGAPSTTPSQSSSMPLQVSLDGERMTTSFGQDAMEPVQLSAGSQ
jgi:hypothetical protein